jgi:hypothetical protein
MPEQTPRRSSGEQPRQHVSIVMILGGCIAGLILVAYFVWLSIEMGGHAQTGAAPMIAVFAAAAVGIAAGGLAMLVGRRRH